LAVDLLRILIVDSNAAFRYALTCHLRSQPDFVVVGEVPSSDDALPRARALAPDVILFDIELPEMGAPGAIRALRQAVPKARIIGFAIVQHGRYDEECRRAGSDARLLKDSPAEVIFEAIRAM
jgi:DNA-binding NarL/FixJ family response regulator